jgi:hypothetical protein
MNLLVKILEYEEGWGEVGNLSHKILMDTSRRFMILEEFPYSHRTS